MSASIVGETEMAESVQTAGEAWPPDKPLVPRCHLPWQEMIIHANGTVEPCCYWTAHGNSNPPLGNINDNSIEEIWNNGNYQKLRHHMLRGELEQAGCANCYAIKQGQGLGLEYDKDCKLPRYADTPYAANIKLLKEEIRRGATRLAAKPTIVSVTASHKCNLACRHCWQNASRERQWTREDAFDEIRALVPTLVRLIAGGGEPLLLARWRRFLGEFEPATAPLLNFAMTTNATVLRAEVMAGLRRFKSLQIIVSLDGANREVYERIRVNASFADVEANIGKLQELVNSRPPTAVTSFGLCMSVMKSNITHLPEFVEWAGRRGLLFSLHPVLSLPMRESLVSFSDPERETAHWREALEETWRVVRTLDTPALPEMWRYMQRIGATSARSGWPHLSAIEDFIPWDLTYDAHYRASLSIPPQSLAAARSQWPADPLDVVFSPEIQLQWRSWTYPYHAAVEGGGFTVHLPLGGYTCAIMPAFGGPSIDIGRIEVAPWGASYVEGSTEFSNRVDAILRC